MKMRCAHGVVWGLVGAMAIVGCAGARFVLERPKASPEKLVSLTFDDGPNGEATERLLDVLRRHQVQATFFLVGKNVERDPHLARRIVEEGHQVGNHSYGHNNFLALQSTASIRYNLDRTNQAIVNATGMAPRYFRPPSGLTTARLERVCRELGLQIVGVHIFVGDSFTANPQRIAQRVLGQVKEGAQIVVLHDGFGAWKWRARVGIAEAADQIITELRQRGYRFVSSDHI